MPRNWQKYLQIFSILGPSWTVFRLIQAVRLRTGYWERKTPKNQWGSGNLALKGQCPYMQFTGDLCGRVRDVFHGCYCLFSRHKVQAGGVPDWFAGYFAGQKLGDEYAGKNHWSRISDFASYDIKGVWELSRFAWVYPLIWAWQRQKNDKAAEVFWKLVEDWASHNLPNIGVHWKCGQEIAIRMFALVIGYNAFQDAEATTEDRAELLAEIVFTSGLRIHANIAYALSQKNNHGMSEAAGLFTAGVMLDETAWIKKGKKLLEQQARDLIYADGAFSQHSVNYHRVMLQVYLWAIQLGKGNNILFPKDMLDRVRKAGQWLLALCDPKTGRCPNLGANDGALIFPVTGCDYLDYRPTIQAVGCVVDGEKWIDSGPWDGLAEFLGAGQGLSLQRSAKRSVTSSNISLTHFDEGGYVVFSSRDIRLLFRCPRSFWHRPGQCDLLHVDLFHNSINVLRDGGSYSYNCDSPWQEYFTSNAAHNTIQFDDHDQMPRLSRFLLGKWPKSYVAVDEKNLQATAGFTDWKGCRHERIIQVRKTGLTIIDRISRFKKQAILRWRLAPEVDWNLNGIGCSSSFMDIKISVNGAPCSVKITQGWESLYYHERTALSVLEVYVGKDCQKLVTEIELK